MCDSTCAYSATFSALCMLVRDASRSVAPDALDDLARDDTKATIAGKVEIAVCAWVRKGSWPVLVGQDYGTRSLTGATCRWGIGLDWSRVLQ